MVTCIAFCPNVLHFLTQNDNQYISGCLDKIIRIWDIKKKKVLEYINLPDLITSIAYFPSGKQIAIGFHNGKVSLFDTLVMNTLKQPKLKYDLTIYCKNRFGKHSNGRKVTGLEFINNNEMLISTNDSRIRLFNIKVF